MGQSSKGEPKVRRLQGRAEFLVEISKMPVAKCSSREREQASLRLCLAPASLGGALVVRLFGLVAGQDQTVHGCGVEDTRAPRFVYLPACMGRIAPIACRHDPRSPLPTLTPVRGQGLPLFWAAGLLCTLPLQSIVSLWSLGRQRDSPSSDKLRPRQTRTAPR